MKLNMSRSLAIAFLFFGFILAPASFAQTQCAAGPLPEVVHQLGPPPAGAFTRVACLSVANDLDYERAEVAVSSIPMPRDLGLTDVGRLVVVGAGNVRIAAQFDAVSRWGATVDDPNAAIRWLQVSVPARTLANSTTQYELRRYESHEQVTDGNAVVMTQESNSWQVDTGVARFTLDPANPALFEAMAVDLEGQGAYTSIYRHAADAGPQLVFESPSGRVAVGGSDRLFASGFGDNTDESEPQGRVTIDINNGFEIVETGPVKAVVAVRGHFEAPAGASLCRVATTTPYERYAFILEATFTRVSIAIGLKFHFVNECSDAFSGPWTDDVANLVRVRWRFPFALPSASAALVASNQVALSNPGGSAWIEQGRGSGAPPDWIRRAEARVDGTIAAQAVAFASPLVAVRSPTVLVSASMPWMRYREPQSMSVRGAMLDIDFVADDLVLGEGKGIWNAVRIDIEPAASATPLSEYLQRQALLQKSHLERGLLVRADLPDLNAAEVMPSLGGQGQSVLHSNYEAWMDVLHSETVGSDGQWDRNKTYGSQLWPESGSSDPFGIDVGQPNDSTAGMNYWDPAGNELLEYLRSGDPKWAWDFAIPAYWTQIHAAYLNTGFRFHGNRNGLAVQAGGPGCELDPNTFAITQCTPDGTGGGQWHRSAFGSDDYTYAMTADLAYILRPDIAMRDRFAQAGLTVLERYDPEVPEAQREAFVNALNITRQVIQHFEMLANCAEFVPGPTGASCESRLRQVVDELARDNLRSGLMCQGVVDFGTGQNGDIPGPPAAPPTQCFTPQQFMQNALMYGFFYRYWANYGDPPSGSVRRALVQAPATLYREGLPTLPGGELLADGAWAAALDCQLSADGNSVLACVASPDSDGMTAMGAHTRPHTAALLLIAHQLDPALQLCEIVRDVFNQAEFTADPQSGAGWGGVGHFNQAGWWKGTSQMLQSMVFALGAYESCTDVR